MKLRWTRWAAVGVLAAFAIFDLCGRRRAVPLPPEDAIRAAAGDVPVLAFDVLADGTRPWPADGAPPPAPLPDAVRAHEGRRVAVPGYVVPLDAEGGRARRFLLSRFAGGCCFTGPMEPDDFVDCTVADARGAEVVTHVPVLVVGTLRVPPPSAATQAFYALDACEVVALPGP